MRETCGTINTYFDTLHDVDKLFYKTDGYIESC